MGQLDAITSSTKQRYHIYIAARTTTMEPLTILYLHIDHYIHNASAGRQKGLTGYCFGYIVYPSASELMNFNP